MGGSGGCLLDEQEVAKTRPQFKINCYDDKYLFLPILGEGCRKKSTFLKN